MPVIMLKGNVCPDPPDNRYAYYASPIGLVEIAGTVDAVTALNFVEHRRQTAEISEPVTAALQQVSEYFDGNRRSFDLPVAPEGTAFQRSVWRELLAVDFGRTASYGDIAHAVGNPKAVRAVGGANGKNPVSIIVPCHRIIGSNGALTGYGGGLWRKRWLLEHEGIRVPSTGRIRCNHLKTNTAEERS